MNNLIQWLATNWVAITATLGTIIGALAHLRIPTNQNNNTDESNKK